MATENGGAAFPTKTPRCKAQSGMTLRDYFAAHASEEDIRHYQEFGAQSYGGPAIEPKYTREQAKYRYASAMLREREGEQQAEANGKDEAQDEG